MKYIIKHLMENKWIMYGGIALKTIGAFLDLAIPSVLKIIIDEDVPMAAVPKTGDAMAIVAALSVLSGAGVCFTCKKRSEK